MKTILVAALLLLSAGAAKSDEIYSYTGPTPADLSGSFTTPNVLPSGAFNFTSFSFTDGVDTWNPSNSVFGGSALVNPDGSFLDWAFTIEVGGQIVAYSQTMYSPFYYQDHTPVGDSWVANQSSFDKPKGSWTMADPVASPEPRAVDTLLFCGMLVALGVLLTRLFLGTPSSAVNHGYCTKQSRRG